MAMAVVEKEVAKVVSSIITQVVKQARDDETITKFGDCPYKTNRQPTAIVRNSLLDDLQYEIAEQQAIADPFFTSTLAT